MIRIGIDPDIDKSGVAIMINGELKCLINLPFHGLMQTIADNFEDYTTQCDTVLHDPNEVHYYIEHVELIKTVWDRPGMTQAGKIKLAQNVGMVKAVGRLIGQKLDECGRDYKLIPPLKGFFKLGKTDAKFFNSLMGWTGRSNADNRDAALLLCPFLKKG